MSSQVKLLPHIKRSDPEKEFELLKQIGSGTYGEVYKVSSYCHTLSMKSLHFLSTAPVSPTIL